MRRVASNSRTHSHKREAHFFRHTILSEPTDSFEVSFLYNAFRGDSGPADGLAFIAQNTTSGPNYLGEDGSGLGFFALTGLPAIAATFDYCHNAYTGSPSETAAIALPVGEDLVQVVPTPHVFGQADYGGFRFVWADYDNPTKLLSAYYAASDQKPATPILSTTLAQDLSSQFGGEVYFGFSGGTGALDSVQPIFFANVKMNP